MTKAPAIMLYWADFDRDTAMLSCETVGGYVRILNHLHFSDTKGKSVKTLGQWQKLMRCGSLDETLKIICDLKEEKICNVVTKRHGLSDFSHVDCHSPIKIINRRMYREYKAKNAANIRKQRSRNKTVTGDVTHESENVTPTHAYAYAITNTSSSLDVDDVLFEARKKLEELGFSDTKKLLGEPDQALFVLHTIKQNPKAGGGLIRQLIAHSGKYKLFLNDLNFKRECDAIEETAVLYSPKRLTEGVWKKDSFDGYVVEIEGESPVSITCLGDLREWQKS